MSMTGLDVFDKTIQLTNEWLKDLMLEMNWEDKRKAYAAIRICLHALRDRLIPDEAVHLGAQLPMLIRGSYYEGWKPSATPKKIRDKEVFVSFIKEAFYDTVLFEEDAETTIRAVFKLLYFRISPGEIDDIIKTFPQDLRPLWPEKR